MGQPHEDLQTLYAIKGRLEVTAEMAKNPWPERWWRDGQYLPGSCPA
jgi:hypothetical protein